MPKKSGKSSGANHKQVATNDKTIPTDPTNESIVPTLMFNHSTGPKNYKLRRNIGEPAFSYVGRWEFDPKSLSYKRFTAEREALAQSISQLLEIPITLERSSSERETIDNECYKARFYSIKYSDFDYTDWNDINLFINDDLSRAIMKRDIDKALQFIQSGTRTPCRIFNTLWTLCNQYCVNPYRDYQESCERTSLTNKTVESGETVLIATVDPVVLAVLTKQSSLAIELLKVDSFNIHSKIDPFNKSLVEIAGVLKLETLKQYMKRVDDVLSERAAPKMSGQKHRKQGGFFDFDESEKTEVTRSTGAKVEAFVSGNPSFK